MLGIRRCACAQLLLQPMLEASRKPTELGSNWVARSSTSFKPGQVANPGGRPKAVRDIQELARQHSSQAIRALVEALTDPKQKVSAACALLDRGYGRPAQSIALHHHIPAAVASDADLVAIALSGGSAAAAPEDDQEEPASLVH